jgi:hypothetical protein
MVEMLFGNRNCTKQIKKIPQTEDKCSKTTADAVYLLAPIPFCPLAPFHMYMVYQAKLIIQFIFEKNSSFFLF